MDPGRAALIAGKRVPDRRDITAPRRDTGNRISKPAQGGPGARPPPASSKTPSSSYMTEEQLSERFVAEEDKFVLRQSKKKADIRVRERRAKAIDFLAFYLRFVDEDHDAFDDEEGDAEIEVPPPEAVLAAAAAQAQAGGGQLQELEADIQSFRTLDKNRQNRAYWQALLVLCRNALEQQPNEGQGQGQGHEDRILDSVAADIDRILRPKSLEQLEALETQIRAKLRSDEPIDTDYWGQLLKRLQVWKAKAALSKIGEAARARRLSLLRARDPAKAEALAAGTRPSGTAAAAPPEDATADATADATTDATTDAATDATTDAATDAATDAGALGNEDRSQATKVLYDREAARGVGENEEIFAAEEVVPASCKPKWADKYRPRKPRYFNRVQMGYEWNKYNQTHYDHDNPPPKVVQGYKFNVFYPELLDKSKAPTYHITREGGRRKGESFARAGEEDTCIIRFSAGPPYEDVAFRIVDREWDYSSKHERGFKSVFEKGILQLHFQFKKVYYRK